MTQRIKTSENLEQMVRHAQERVTQMRLETDKAEEKKEELQLQLEQARVEAERKRNIEEESGTIEREIGEISGG